jgi:hypothetical protein
MPKAVSLCRILVAAAVLATAACGGSPTGARDPAMRPSFDTGFGFGSGNRGRNDSTATTTAAAPSGSTAARGGVTLGSGS